MFQVTATGTDCASMGMWDTDSSSESFAHWFEKSDSENTCEPTVTMTGYNAFSTRDYMRCVCDSWGQDMEDCLSEVADPTDSGALAGTYVPLALLASMLLFVGAF